MDLRSTPAPVTKTWAWLNLTPVLILKVAGSTVLMATGMFYLATGRREANMGRILTGAVLTMASIFLFF